MEGKRETEGRILLWLEAGPADPVLPLGSPTPFSQRFPVPTLKNDSTTLARNRRQFPSARLCPATRSLYARCDDVRPTVFAASFPLSLALSSRAPFCTFSFAPSNFPFIVFVASLLSSPPCSFLFFLPSSPFSLLLSLPLFPSLLQCGPHARPTLSLARAPRAIQHTWPVGRSCSAECAVLPPAGDCVTWPPGRNGTQHGLCSLVSRAHDTSQRRTERPDRQRLHSLPGSACGAFSLPLFPILSLSFFLPRALPPCTVPSSSVSFFYPSVPVNTRAIHHALETARTPVLFISSATTCNPSVFCVYALPRGSRRIGQPIQVVHRGKNIA